MMFKKAVLIVRWLKSIHKRCVFAVRAAPRGAVLIGAVVALLVIVTVSHMTTPPPLSHPLYQRALQSWNASDVSCDRRRPNARRVVSQHDSNPWLQPPRGSSSYSLSSGSACPKRIVSGQVMTQKLRSVIGCGGLYRPGASHGDRVSIEYVAEQHLQEIDACLRPGNVSFTLGASRMPFRAWHTALRGVCESEILLLKIPSLLLTTRPFAPFPPSSSSPSAAATTTTAARIVSHVKMLILVLEITPNPADPRAAQHRAAHEEALQDSLAARLRTIAARRGQNCDSACERHGLRCAPEAFEVVNQCPRLAAEFHCAQCEVAAVGTAGPDMPCFVSPRAPVGHPRGTCMVAPDVSKTTCAARYEHTHRLCPCLEPSSSSTPQTFNIQKD
mmetsp:Transcript_1806/g.3910  ORF Transcript_1806/g.3910 Transcript_1806/m.3910 type:complete len:387 (+) Transcript_1806:1152-2312(+)